MAPKAVEARINAAVRFRLLFADEGGDDQIKLHLKTTFNGDGVT